MARLRFASLGSGSRGNATLVQTADGCLLIDAGLPLTELERRCTALGLSLGKLDAVLVTHEHGDHIRGIQALVRRYQVPVWMTRGTWIGGGLQERVQPRLIEPNGDEFAVAGIRVQPLPVPHDAREPCQFRLAFGGVSLALVTDLGHPTPHLLQALQGLDALILEANHDPQMLHSGPYPPALQARVGGAYGHLSNAQAMEILAAIDHARLHSLHMAHISEKNNRPELVAEAVARRFPELATRTRYLEQDRVSGWQEIG